MVITRSMIAVTLEDKNLFNSIWQLPSEHLISFRLGAKVDFLC